MPLLRAPVLALKWLAVTFGVLAWLIVAPLMDIVSGAVRAVRRIFRPRSGKSTADE